MYTICRYVIGPHTACNGKGCEECDYEGRMAERKRTAAEMVDLYMAEAESCWLTADDKEDGTYYRGRGDTAAQRAAYYAALAQAEAHTRIAAALEEALADREAQDSFNAIVDLYRGAGPAH